MVACKILMLSDFYMYYICVTLYVIQLLAAKYGNKIYLSIQKFIRFESSFVVQSRALYIACGRRTTRAYGDLLHRVTYLYKSMTYSNLSQLTLLTPDFLPQFHAPSLITNSLLWLARDSSGVCVAITESTRRLLEGCHAHWSP